MLTLGGAVAAKTILLAVSPGTRELTTSQPLDGFVSFSIEFSSFPDFAGNTSNPNSFSNNLLDNIGYLTGTKPYIRVGGNTQDYAIYNADLPVALNGTFNTSRSEDYPTTIEIGPSFFESYGTWPNARFSHGFNMGGNHDDRQWQTLLDTVPLACKSLGRDGLYWWEYGNEADLFATSAQGPVRPESYNESDFVAEWLNGTRAIKAVIEQACPDMVSNETYGYLAPSFAGTSNHLSASLSWADGLNEDRNIKFYASHNYIASAETLGVTLQGTLMNHTRTRQSVDAHIREYAAIAPAGIPHILAETNSLSNEGKPGLSNSFGAALWAVDFGLYCAAAGVGRVHTHLGTNYRYASWQPIETDRAVMGTKAPYYANIAVAAFVGNSRIEPVAVAELPLGGGDGGGGTNNDDDEEEEDDDSMEAAYAAYVNNVLMRIMVINLRAYNYTINGTGPGLNPAPRPARTFSFDVGGTTTAAADDGTGVSVGVSRLLANGSDAVTGISWDGWSYNYELDAGRPVRLGNVTVGETAEVRDGVVTVAVPDSQAVMLDFGPA
ncbi:glycoside hydrolase family 79 protein [Xylariomycetidae sp. FL2044]|nr:glycoside hydrolase family 79 protein [Xylariomycetidae sp. FL2044]